jgi:hypothetical protein
MIVSSAFWSVLVRHPLTWLVVALTGGAQVLFHDWFAPDLLASTAFGAVGLVTLVLWPPLFASSNAWRTARITAADNLDRITVEKLQQLEQTLRQLNAEQAIAQLRGLREKLSSVSAVVDQRLNAGELAFARYRGTADQVYLSAVDNLHDVAASLTSVRAIDIDYIARREAELAVITGDTSDDDGTELKTLRERSQLHADQIAKVNALMRENEAAMTALANAAAALANVRTQSGHARVDANTAMVELEQLASRAGRYAATPTRK